MHRAWRKAPRARAMRVVEILPHCGARRKRQMGFAAARTKLHRAPREMDAGRAREEIPLRFFRGAAQKSGGGALAFAGRFALGWRRGGFRLLQAREDAVESDRVGGDGGGIGAGGEFGERAGGAS